MNIEQQGHFIKTKARELGFSFCGFSKAEFLEEEAQRLEDWLFQERHGKLDYMANWFDKRLDPTKLVPGAKTVISLLFNYHNPALQKDEAAPKISSYAYGADYHHVVKGKLKLLVNAIEESIGQVEGRAFVDSAPVLEKAWAAKSGLGWVGKNTNLINKSKGSFFFLAELIIDLKLVPDNPISDYCGTCTACLDACPTDAFYEPFKLDASKCISYLTIELKDEVLPNEFKGKMDNWMFGCDICQTVCPWNRFSEKHEEPAFEPHPDLLHLTKSDWLDLSEEVFQGLFRKTAVKRTKFKGLKRNIDFLK